MTILACPVCRASNETPPTCRRCKADLSLLFALEERRAALIDQARFALAEQRWQDARDAALHADHLRQDEWSRQLVAVTALMTGDPAQAWAVYAEICGEPN